MRQTKLLALSSFILILYLSFSPVEIWWVYEYDDIVSIQVQHAPVIEDTLGKIMFSSQTRFGKILMSKIVEEDLAIVSEGHLKSAYESFLSGFSGENSLNLVSSQYDTLRGLKCTRYQLYDKSKKILVDGVFLFVGERGYVFHFLYDEIYKFEAKPKWIIFSHPLGSHKLISL